MSITPEQIAAWRGLCRDATEGPWESAENLWYVRSAVSGAYVSDAAPLGEEAVPTAVLDANLAFIAAAREALPRLLDEVERLQGICYRTGYTDLSRSRDRLKREVERLRALDKVTRAAVQEHLDRKELQPGDAFWDIVLHVQGESDDRA